MTSPISFHRDDILLEERGTGLLTTMARPIAREQGTDEDFQKLSQPASPQSSCHRSPLKSSTLNQLVQLRRPTWA